MKWIKFFLWISFATQVNIAFSNEVYPTKTIRFIVSYAVGGMPDIVILRVGQRLSEKIVQPLVIDNLPGAGGFNEKKLLELGVNASWKSPEDTAKHIAREFKRNKEIYSKANVKPE